jgi:hypothetical protein
MIIAFDRGATSISQGEDASKWLSSLTRISWIIIYRNIRPLALST